MTTLRILLAEPVAPERADAWALYDERGGLLRTGVGRPADWPAAARHEAVVAARRVRVAVLHLPLLPAAQLAAAAAYAIEDQLAGSGTPPRLAVSPQAPDGTVRVTIVDSALVRALRDGSPPAPRFARVVAEPDLAPPAPGWHWYVDAARPADAFVRGPDGAVAPTGDPGADAALPGELVLAFAHLPADARRLAVHGDPAPATRERLHAVHGIDAVTGDPWQWQHADPRTFAAAPDLAPPAPGTDVAARAPLPRSFRLALGVAAAAIAIHVVATLVQWIGLEFDAYRSAAKWKELAVQAGIGAAASMDAPAARAALYARHAELRHAAGLAAPGDALPQLARAAPALALLPPGGLKSATFAAGGWTLDVGLIDTVLLARIDAAMKAAGVPALVATTPAGTRIRIEPRP